jgi:hypothetical protein
MTRTLAEAEAAVVAVAVAAEQVEEAEAVGRGQRPRQAGHRPCLGVVQAPRLVPRRLPQDRQRRPPGRRAAEQLLPLVPAARERTSPVEQGRTSPVEQERTSPVVRDRAPALPLGPAVQDRMSQDRTSQAPPGHRPPT